MSYLGRTVTPTNGVQVAFPVSFPFQSRSDVSVYVHLDGASLGVPKVETVDWNWTSDGIITFTAPPANGLLVDIRRGTMDTALDNIFNAPSSISARELTENDTQLLYITQELEDGETDLDIRVEVMEGQNAAGNTIAISRFIDAPTKTIPGGSDRVRTSGYSVVGSGGADYVYDAAVNAAYVTANPRTSFISANGRGFKLSTDQAIQLTMFGLVADNATDNYPAIQAAIDLSKATQMTTQYGYGKGSFGLFLPAAQQAYYCSQKLVISHTLRWEFENGAGAAGGSAVLRFPAGSGGILLQHDNITGGGAGSVLIRPFLKGGFVATEGEFHGIEMQVACEIIGAKIYDFQGDGIFADTHGTGYIVNGSVIHNSFVQGCRNGIYLYGEDANALTIVNPVGISNRRYGHYQKLTLGSSITGGNSSDNGMVPGWPTVCSYLGNQYYCLPNQEVGAKANAPSGTTATNTYWGYWRAGGVTSVTPAWVANATNFRTGGGARFEGSFEQNTVCALYFENDQPPIQAEASTQMLFMSPLSGTPVIFDGTPYGGALSGGGATMTASRGFTCKGDFHSTIGGVDILRTASNGIFANSVIWIAPDVGAILEVGRVFGGVNARIRPDATAPGLALLSPDNTERLVITNTGIASNIPFSATNFSGTHSGTSSGTNTGDQTITLTGDVAGSGTGSFAATIQPASVTFAKMANVATGTVFYRKTASTGSPEVQTLATLKADLGLTGTNSGDQTSIVGISGTLAQFNTACSDADFVPTGLATASGLTSTTGKLIGRSTAGTGALEELATLPAANMPALTGDVTTVAGALAATIPVNTVTYAKMQDVSATARLLGRASAGAGDTEELTVTGGLAFVGTALSLTGAIAPSSVATAGLVKSSGLGGVGYATGAGSSVTQLTSKSTAPPAINKDCGQIITNNASLAAAGVVSFTVSNSEVAATDTINLNLKSGPATPGSYRYWIEAVAAGTFTVTIENRSAGALAEALTFNFAIIKAVNA